MANQGCQYIAGFSRSRLTLKQQQCPSVNLAHCLGDGDMSYLQNQPYDEKDFPAFAAIREQLGFLPNFFVEQTARPDMVEAEIAMTGNLILKPDHHQEPNAPAAWRYYEILTRIRTELQKRRHPNS